MVGGAGGILNCERLAEEVLGRKAELQNFSNSAAKIVLTGQVTWNILVHY